MSKQSKLSEAVVLLIDVGKNVKNGDNDSQNFLNKSKECASRIIQRKIFSENKDEFSLVLIGSENTVNELDYPNINVINSFLTAPNWDMLSTINRLCATDVNNADWLDGLIVAINLLKTESECKKFEELKIVMISNFASPLRSRDQVDVVIEALKDLKINLVVIGPQNEEDDNSSEDDSQLLKIQKKGEALIGRIVDETEGSMYGFQEVLSLLDHFQKVVARAAPWRCDLEIGSGIFIPITGFKKFAAKNVLKWEKGTLQNTDVTKESVFFRGDEQVDKFHAISSYLFGRSVVPTSEEDKSSMALWSERSFKLLGFTKKETVPRHMAMGDSVYYITARSDEESSKIAVTALVKALLELERVAIVRKVYCKNAAPRVGALIPTCEHGSYFFYYVQLPFEEDEKPAVFPSLRRVQPSEAQLEAVDQLIDDMDLSLLEEEDEDPYSKLVDPSLENTYNSIVFKALHPDSVLPTEPSETVKNLIKPKIELLENASSALEKIKEMFRLEEIEQKSYRKGAAEVFKSNGINGDAEMEVEDVKNENMADTMAGFVQSTVTEIGTVDPEGNFLKLLELGEPFSKLRDQMQIAIKKLFLTSSNAVGIQKPLSALSLLRKHCVTQDPLSYNQFIASVKDALVERDHSEFWSRIVQDKLGLITNTEAEQSGVSTEDGETFYLIKKCESLSENYEMEAEDMLDMMM